MGLQPVAMPVLWRISNHIDLGGYGGVKFASRWTSLGKRVVYLAESPAGAMLETLVHLTDPENPLPSTYTLIEINTPGALAVKQLPEHPDSDWRVSFDLTRRQGDEWLERRETSLARVPPAVVTRTRNW